MSKQVKKSRRVIPIDFKPELIEKLEIEADSLGLKTAAYIRHLVITHQARQNKLAARK